MATLEELEIKIDKIQWQLQTAIMLMPEGDELTLGYFVVLFDIAKDELDSLEVIMTNYDAIESFNKDDLTNELLAELTEHPTITGHRVITSFYNSGKHIDVCEKWLRQ